ncbi:MAG TPA: hypothetical protein VFJ19_11490 [Nocardioidaceae bacterium]|nr:hypothetical protein [Nocardioidaceae bacterium]
MGISATGRPLLSLRSITYAGIVFGVLLGFVVYLYGPRLSPTLHASATKYCNEYAGGNFRDYRLSWVSGTSPHWSCWDARHPQKPAVSLGWWVNPFH